MNKQQRVELYQEQCKDIINLLGLIGKHTKKETHIWIKKFCIHYREFHWKNHYDYDIYEKDESKMTKSLSHLMMREVGYEELKLKLEERLMLMI
jgi:hypothetical protein